MLEKYAQFHEAIYNTIKEIPFGEVATYSYVGEIAENLSGLKLPYPENEVAYVVNAHDSELPFHRVIYTYIMFRNEHQKTLLIEENAINCILRQVKYWTSPLESQDRLDKVHSMMVNNKLQFRGLQEYFYFSHENHPLAFTVKNRQIKRPLLKTRCLCTECTAHKKSVEPI